MAAVMNENLNPADLGQALEQALTIYSSEITARIDAAGEESMEKIVRLSKANAPTGRRGKFKRFITMSAIKTTDGTTRYIWHVKSPEHRLAHLLANGHATLDGGRTKADPFLKNAVDAVLPEYQAAVEEAIRSG